MTSSHPASHHPTLIAEFRSLLVVDPDAGKAISKPVSFDLQAQEISIIAGPNGVGKSTLLHAVNEMLSSEATRHPRVTGDVMLKSKKVATRFHPQISAPMFALPLSLGDVIHWGQEDHESPSSPLLEGVDLQRPWDSASGGEKQRVLLASLLSESFFSPEDSLKDLVEVLLLDEPGNHLDSKNQQVLRKQIQMWLERGPNRSVLLVTHDPENWVSSKMIHMEPFEHA